MSISTGSGQVIDTEHPANWGCSIVITYKASAKEVKERLKKIAASKSDAEPCCDFNSRSMWHHDFDCENFVTCY